VTVVNDTRSCACVGVPRISACRCAGGTVSYSNAVGIVAFPSAAVPVNHAFGMKAIQVALLMY